MTSRHHSTPAPPDWPARLTYLGLPPVDAEHHQHLISPHRSVDHGVAWHHEQLPHPHLASAGMPRSEGLLSLLVVAVALVPLLVLTRWSWGAFVAAGIVLAALGFVLWSRRVIVGGSYIAVRQLGRYHVATLEPGSAPRLHPSRRGGVLVVDTDDGHHLRMRAAEAAEPEMNQVLHHIVEQRRGVASEKIEGLLDVAPDARPQHRLLADLYR